MNKEEFKLECSKIGIDITDEIFNKFEMYKDLLIEWNNKFNLTTIIKEEDIYLKHFFDSLYITKFHDFNNKKICDFGTGAGFPGMVLAIIFNNSKFTLIESNSKKTTFLEHIKTCRAVSNLSIILELAISMLKVNGLFIPMKSNIEEEFEKSKKNLNSLGYRFINLEEYYLPIENSKRTILIYEKIKKTDLKYPRNYNIIKKQ